MNAFKTELFTDFETKMDFLKIWPVLIKSEKEKKFTKGPNFCHRHNFFISSLVGLYCKDLATLYYLVVSPATVF
jgi:hypothetical protein